MQRTLQSKVETALMLCDGFEEAHPSRSECKRCPYYPDSCGLVFSDALAIISSQRKQISSLMAHAARPIQVDDCYPNRMGSYLVYHRDNGWIVDEWNIYQKEWFHSQIYDITAWLPLPADPDI